jgi:hypothetical protein
MGAPFSPTPQDVERYRTLRAASVALSQRIVETIPHQAWGEIGDALGIRRNGVLAFDNQDMTSVMADCCLYNWLENGKNLVRQYAETHPAAPGTDESYLSQAYLQAKYRILVPQSAVPDAGLYCQDVLNGGDLFLMDLALSHTTLDGKTAIATRTIPLGEYSMTGGAVLPFISDEDILDRVRQIDAEHQKRLQGPSGVALLIARARFARRVANNVAYKSTEIGSTSKPPRRLPGWPGSKRGRH